MEQDLHSLTFQPVIQLFAGNPWLQGGAVLLLTFLFASLISWLVFWLVKKITTRTKTNIDNVLAGLLRPPVYYTLLMTGFYTAIHIMPLSDKVVSLSINGFKTIGVLIWTLFFIRFVNLILKQISQLPKKYRLIRIETLPLFDNISRILIFIIGLYIFFLIWKIDMTAWLASAGIVGIAVGFAAKDTLANLFSGMFIMADAPYKIGDYIVLDSGERGKITHIGLRSTRLLTRDDVEITIPNSIIGNSKIVNQSGGPHKKFRLRVKVGVAYGSDIDAVRKILLDVANDEPLVCRMPSPRVRFRVFGASSLDFELLCWARDPELRGRALDELNDKIYKEFASQRIEIPYAKQDLYIKEFPNAREKKDS